MAPLPKRRHSTRRGGKRKASIKLKLLGLIKCPKCGTLRLSHRVCPHCGSYNGREVIKKKEEKKKKS